LQSATSATWKGYDTMTVEILLAVREYVEAMARDHRLYTVDALLRQIDQQIEDKRSVADDLEADIEQGNGEHSMTRSDTYEILREWIDGLRDRLNLVTIDELLEELDNRKTHAIYSI